MKKLLPAAVGLPTVAVPSWVAVALAAVLALGLVTGCAPAEEEHTWGVDGVQADAPAERDDATSDAPSNADLDAFAAKVTRQVKNQFGSFNGMYSEIRVDPVYPNGIEYVYVFVEPVDPAAFAKNVATFKPTLQVTFDTQVAPDLEAHGFTDPNATFTYLNPDGSRIWTHIFTKS